MKSFDYPRSFCIAIAIEFGLAVVAVLGGWFTHIDWWRNIHWGWSGVGLGLVTILPLLALLFWISVSPFPPFVRIRDLMEYALRPFFTPWSWWQLAAISIVAGISEEALFRGFIQGGLTQWLGFWPALVIASLIFAGLHLLTWAYAVVVFVIGCYLGYLWMASGNLLTPMLAHATYDFIALVYFLKRSLPSPSRSETAPR